MRYTGKAGFTLLELLVVVIIIGILASVALPQFSKATDRAREPEGMNVVAAVLTGEFAYFQEKGTFTATATELLVTIPPAMQSWKTPSFTGATSGTVKVALDSSGHGHATDAAHKIEGTVDTVGTRLITVTRP